jgi:hypothetical protein
MLNFHWSLAPQWHNKHLNYAARYRLIVLQHVKSFAKFLFGKLETVESFPLYQLKSQSGLC